VKEFIGRCGWSVHVCDMQALAASSQWGSASRAATTLWLHVGKPVPWAHFSEKGFVYLVGDLEGATVTPSVTDIHRFRTVIQINWVLNQRCWHAGTAVDVMYKNGLLNWSLESIYSIRLTPT
jgi:hypothetical protein